MAAVGASLSAVAFYFGMAGVLVLQGLRPLTWRRPVRAEFWRFMEMLTLRNLIPVCVTAALIGFALVAQGLYWLDQLGEVEEVSGLLTSLLIREIAPLFVGFLTLGRGGLILLGEVGALRTTQRLHALDRQGLDPLLLLVVPRSAAIIVAQFSHTVVFIVVAFVAGYLGAVVADVTSTSLPDFLWYFLTRFGEQGFLAVPLKCFFMGLTISTVCGLSALTQAEGAEFGPRADASGLIRGLSALLIVSSLLTILI